MKNVQISFLKLLSKTCAFPFLRLQAFKKDKRDQNMTTESGSKQRFCLLQEKVVIQAVCLKPEAVSIKARFRYKVVGQCLGNTEEIFLIWEN